MSVGTKGGGGGFVLCFLVILEIIAIFVIAREARGLLGMGG